MDSKKDKQKTVSSLKAGCRYNEANGYILSKRFVKLQLAFGTAYKIWGNKLSMATLI